MSAVPLKFHGNVLWWLAAVGVCAFEIYAAGGRVPDVVADSAGSRPRNGSDSRPATRLALGDLGTDASVPCSAILVLGNVGSLADGVLEVTLTATPAPPGGSSNSARRHARPLPPRELPPARRCPSATPFRQPVPPDGAESRRTYFLQAGGLSVSDLAHAAIPCRLALQNERVRIYLDERIPADAPLLDLVNAVDQATRSSLVDVVQQMVGNVRDVDGDGRLAVVLTPEVARLGTGRTPVDGLTRSADFDPAIDRPHGNASDVIFLSTRLVPGDQLRAVLAHEWCHAAVFGRRQHGTAAGDDWLNEALAHIVEVRASGSASNVSHRIEKFLAAPGASPLAVRDYSRPEYWRHDGCRGAGYLFLQWCLDRSDESLLERLTTGQELGIDRLEAATGRSFATLFQGWTTSLGRHLAMADDGRFPIRPAPHVWRVDGTGEQSLTLRIRGTCAEYLRVDCGEGTWRLSATLPGVPKLHGVSGSATDSERLQATLIPVERTAAMDEQPRD